MSDTKIYSAYHGSDDVKQVFIGRMKAHMQADELIRGTGFRHGRGCAVGCTLNKYDHSAYPRALGMPQWVAYLNDALHENTSKKVWPTLQLRFLDAAEPGANLNNIYHPIYAFSLGLAIESIEKMNFHNASKKQIIDSIAAIKRLHDIKCTNLAKWRVAAKTAWEVAREAIAWEVAREALRGASRGAAWEAAWGIVWMPEEEAAKAAVCTGVCAGVDGAAGATAEAHDRIAEEFIRLVELEEGKWSRW